jgi:hypothetical protein
MDTYNFTSLRFKDWQEFKQYIQKFSENWAFRGQGNAEWILNNAIERTNFITFFRGVEAQFLAEFQRGARNYLTKDETPEHLIEWLALMQHHGAPTRLLDLTRSPFIAAYFAYEFCHPAADHHIAIWCINVNYLRTRAVEILSEEFGDDLQKTNNLINEKVFERIFYDNNRSLVFPVEPFRMNRRYSLQQSIFISTGTSETPLMQQLQFLGEDLPKAVVRLEVPACHKNEVLRDLLKMNLHRASLFPDLDGYALSLKLRYDSMKPPEQMITESVMRFDDKEFPFVP